MAQRAKGWPLVLVIFVLLLVGTSRAEGPGVVSARIGQMELKGTKTVLLTSEDLTIKGEVLIEGEAEGEVEKVEVSLDGGRTWQEAKGGARWSYAFRPTPRQGYLLTIRVTDRSGARSVPAVDFGLAKLTYLPMTTVELVQQRTQELALAYMSRDLERYMALISRNYRVRPRGWLRLRRAIEYDFRSLEAIVLRFTVKQVFRTGGEVLAEVDWRLVHSGLTEPREGSMTIAFDRADGMKILLQRGELYFTEAPIGYDARIILEPLPYLDRIRITVIDRDKAGAGTVSAYVRITVPSFSGTVTLLEDPPRSGRFVTTRPFNMTALVSCTATYVDEITSDWRRNVRRTETYVVP